MKRLLVVSIAMILTGTSLASISTSEKESFGKPSITASSAKTVTRNAQAIVKLPRIPKPKLLRSNPHRAAYFIFADDNDDIEISDDDKITGYRKRDLQKVKASPTQDDPEGEITDNIRWRLFLARQAALLKYREVSESST